ncbi:hypothetical protein HPP92_003497 [Vanilla planifolia]|uniref:Uncharacterized protein n=1 Tax=Vanilla planifolia TaxID=51239 RepID=A0A835S820_VANPL|nr:hypothetical protein HPP92_003888 [Vanilla planifolia]KAG0503425.1 hypothetical protein HPP92_003497 [Vanilla planifolia]
MKKRTEDATEIGRPEVRRDIAFPATPSGLPPELPRRSTIAGLEMRPVEQQSNADIAASPSYRCG